MSDKSSIAVLTDNIYKTYRIDKDDITVLNGISLTIQEGETVAIVGPSGAGKSTLLHIIGLMTTPSAGHLRINGINKFSNNKILSKYRNSIIGFVFQSYNLLPEFTVVENVMMPLLIAGVNRESAEIRAKEMLEKVGLASRIKHLPSELSGGEQQRVALTRAVINKPKILIADEPTGNLDRNTGNNIMDLVFKMHSTYGFTLIMATHNDEIAGRCGRVIKLLDGKII